MLESLRTLLRRASATPYYAASLAPVNTEKVTPADLGMLPILTRAAVRQNIDGMLAVPSHGLDECKTSGTSDASLTVYLDKDRSVRVGIRHACLGAWGVSARRSQSSAEVGTCSGDCAINVLVLGAGHARAQAVAILDGAPCHGRVSGPHHPLSNRIRARLSLGHCPAREACVQGWLVLSTDTERHPPHLRVTPASAAQSHLRRFRICSHRPLLWTH